MYKILGSLVQRFDMVKNIEIKHVILLKTILRAVTNTLTVLVCNFQAGATASKKKKKKESLDKGLKNGTKKEIGNKRRHPKCPTSLSSTTVSFRKELKC